MFVPYEIKAKISGKLIYVKSITTEGKTVEYDPPVLLQVTTDAAIFDVAPPESTNQTKP